jgi:hypothetical protein
MTARLNFLDFVNVWTKGGIMFRQSLAAGSPHAFVLASPEKGLAVQYRAAAGGLSATGGSFAKNSPGEFGPGFWLQLVREGDVFTGYFSTDKVTWTSFGQAVVSMPADVLVGIAVTSHDVANPAHGLFDDAPVRRAAFQPTPTPPFER